MNIIKNQSTHQLISPSTVHIPVLLHEVMAILDPKPGEFFIDATIDGGGYATAILERLGTAGKFLGVDWDRSSIERMHQALLPFEQKGIHVSLVNDNFAHLPQLTGQEFGKADGLVLDLGFSSNQLQYSGRGFSFKSDDPLCMTYSDDMVPVRELLKTMSEETLSDIIKNLSQERFAKRIAHAIYQAQQKRAIETSKELADIILSAVPKTYERGRIHPATRTFMALRMYANRELENLELILKHLSSMLNRGGRIAIVSFHSLEDKLVKTYFRQGSKVGELQVLTKKPVIPTRAETQMNPRARSGKLRGAVIL